MSEKTGIYPHPPPDYTTSPPPSFQSGPGMASHITVQPGVIPNQSIPGAVHVVTVQAPTVGPQPSMVVCPSCHSNVVTRMEREATSRTHLFALGLCLLGCWPCVCIPYCSDSCQSSNHYCPSCNAYIGSYAS